MIYADVPAAATIFVDASVFIHHFEPNALYGPASTTFLERIENQEITGVTTTHMISEIAHRLMTIEAMQAGTPAVAWQLGAAGMRALAICGLRPSMLSSPSRKDPLRCTNV